MRGLLGFVLPHFVTEDVGCMCEDDNNIAYPKMPMDIWDVEEDGLPDCVVTIKSFSWFGWSIFGKAISEPITYHEWSRHD